MTITNEKAKEIRKLFPIFDRKINNRRIVFLDNANTSQKPSQVIEAISSFYTRHNSNIHRGVYELSIEATDIYEKAHRAVASLVNCEPEEVIFTSGTTESINMLAYGLPSLVDLNNSGKDEIVLTEMEHHANIVPWQQLAKRCNLKLKYIRITNGFDLDYKHAESIIGRRTALVAFTAVSNALGSVIDCNRLIKLAHKNNALTFVDVAQLMPHATFDLKGSGADMIAFSAHKLIGPTGLGFLCGRKELLEKMMPSKFGGDMISRVEFNDAEWNVLPIKFEGGTPNIAAAAGLIPAIELLNSVGQKEINKWCKELQQYAQKEMKKLKYIELYAPARGSGIISFNIKGVHPHDAASLLSDYGICIRAGHHCTMPLMNKLGIPGTLRASFYLYNTIEDVDTLIEGIKAVKEVF